MLYDALVIGVGLWFGFLFITATVVGVIKTHEWAEKRFGKNYLHLPEW
jgi:hypothetical protein